MWMDAEPVLTAPRPGERLLSFDISPGGRTVLAIDDGTRSFVRFDSGVEVALRKNHGTLTVAAFGDDAAVVVSPRTAPQQANAWVVTEGRVETGFFAGDAIQDLLVLPNGSIVCSYFDEGIGEPVSEEGVAVFSRDGSLRRGYQLSTGTSIMDCYAAVPVGSETQ
jgi:hypothetical protein